MNLREQWYGKRQFSYLSMTGMYLGVYRLYFCTHHERNVE